ncbi:MAG: L-threonylcarbamoyladenylate synthase [Prochloraceae cyanobacterium]
MNLVSLEELVAGAKRGKVVSFPTDTVAGLAVLPEKSQLIFSLKNRPQNKPLILMGATGGDLWPYVRGSSEELAIWQEVGAKYWPGALTLVLPSSDRTPLAMHPTEPESIGIRIPNRSIALTILSQTGPLATTSANISGQPAIETMSEVAGVFQDILVLDTKEDNRGSGMPSTVAKWTGTGWKILRRGSIKI